MIDKKDKIITLQSGKKYIIIEQCIFKNVPYYFACELIDDKITENFKVMTIYNNGEYEKIKIITDDEIIKQVCTIIDKKIE